MDTSDEVFDKQLSVYGATKMTTNQRLLAITASMPCKQICIDGNPYLQRMYAGTTRDNKDLWLHRFLSADSERHLHCHPFHFSTWIINGGYTEQRLDRTTKEKESVFHGVINADIESIEKFCKRINHGISAARPWAEDFIRDNEKGRPVDVFDWHRIETALPETWTALIVDPERLPSWFFIDDNGALEMRNSSPRDWWKSYGVRGENRGDVL